MIGFVTVGTNDLPRAAAFYDELFGAIHGHRIYSSEEGSIWSLSQISPGFGVFKPVYGEPALQCSGSLVALALVSKHDVDAMYRLALSLGATEDSHHLHDSRFYMHYFRDLDGNRLGVYFMDEQRHHGRV